MDRRGQTSARDARDVLGLPTAPPSRPRSSANESLSVSVASSSADSADVAGGRGSLSSLWRDNSTTRAFGWEPTPSPTPPPLATTMNGTKKNNVDNSSAIKRSPPKSSASTNNVRGVTGPSTQSNTSGYDREGGVKQGRGVPPPTDPFWVPVLPETEPTAAFPEYQRQARGMTSERLIVSEQPRYNSNYPHSYRPGRAARRGETGWGAGSVDRPASRGQEYRRERGRGRGRLASSSSSSSLTSISRLSDNTGDGQQHEEHLMADGRSLYTTTLRRRSFLGLRWPFFSGGRRSGRGDAGIISESIIDDVTRRDANGANNKEGGGSLLIKGSGLGKDVFDVRTWSLLKNEGLLSSDRRGAGGLQQLLSSGDNSGLTGGVDLNTAGGRLGVKIEGSTELGKGLKGHTAYRIQVADRAIGEQWTVLRRFRQFEALHRGLLPVLSREPDANAYALPPKELFGGRHGGVIAKRLKLLKVYLDRLVTCSAAVEHRAMSSFLELDPALRGLGAYARQHGPECVIKEGRLRVKEWKGPQKSVINILEAGLRLIGWVNCYAIVSPGPVFLLYRAKEDDPEKPLWTLPERRTIGSQIRVRRVEMWRSDLEKDKTRFFIVTWENTSLLCQVDSESALESWAHAIDEDVDLRPQQSEQERAKVDIELKAKEAWTTREEGLWGGL